METLLGKLAVALGLLSQCLAQIPPETIIIKNAPEQAVIYETTITLKNKDIWDGYPLLKKICSCESAYGSPDNEPRQWDEDGALLRGELHPADSGACQINLDVHLKTAQSMGLDVEGGLEDNVEYAKFLFDKEGTKPWSASRGCWSRK